MDSASRKPAIIIRALVERFHFRPVLNQLSLTLEDGDFCVLVCANGAGKTTLLRILATLTRPNQGQVLIHGVPLNAAPSTRW